MEQARAGFCFGEPSEFVPKGKTEPVTNYELLAKTEAGRGLGNGLQRLQTAANDVLPRSYSIRNLNGSNKNATRSASQLTQGAAILRVGVWRAGWIYH